MNAAISILSHFYSMDTYNDTYVALNDTEPCIETQLQGD